MNKTVETMIKRTIANEMGVKKNQVTLLESWSAENDLSDFDTNEIYAFNIRYNLYTNEGYKGNILQYSEEDKMLLHSIEVAEQYRD